MQYNGNRIKLALDECSINGDIELNKTSTLNQKQLRLIDDYDF